MSVEIIYTAEDRWDIDDPDMYAILSVEGEINHVWESEDGEERERIGKLTMSKIQLGEVGWSYLSELLDYHSDMWSHYTFLTDWIYDDEYPEDFEEAAAYCRNLVLVDSLEIDPSMRGQNLGLHILARAILSWADEHSIVLLTAAPLYRDDETSRQQWDKGAKKLAKHWSQLGLARVEGTMPAILYGSRCYRDFDERLKAFALGREVAA